MSTKRFFYLGCGAFLALFWAVTADSASPPVASSAPLFTPTPVPTLTPPTPTSCPNSYNYTVSTGTIVSNTTLLPGSQCGACVVNVTLPFPFSFYGQTYTSANLSTQGNLQFTTTHLVQNTCPLPEPLLGPAMMPHWDEFLETGYHPPCQAAMGSPCGIYTSVSGSPPNRIFKIEWRARYLGTSQHTANFEIRLYENSPYFEYLYGWVSYTGGYATIGVQDGGCRFTTYSCNTWNNIQPGTRIGWGGTGGTPTPTVTPTGTPTDPEYLILQYVVDNYSNWTCQGPTGTPGHRQITDCNPYGFFSHPTSGYVDRYPSPNEAQAAWLTRREIAYQQYPIFFDVSFAGYPGYDAGNTNYPYAHYESYYWASNWVMGAVSSDDTHFRGSPPVAQAIINAARTLGYLGGGTQTVTTTPTATPTIQPTFTPTISPPCGIITFGTPGTTYCTSPTSYYYAFTFYAESGCPPSMNGTATVTYEVAPNSSGPWTAYDTQTYPVTFQRGWNSSTGTFEEPGIPPQYQWYRISFSATFPNNVNAYAVTDPARRCDTGTVTPTTATPTATPSRTATATITGIPVTSTPSSTFTTPGITHTATLTGTPAPCNISFTDVPPDNTFYAQVRCLACRGIVSGYSDGTFKPNNQVTRGQLAKIVSNSAAFSEPVSGQTFQDVPPNHTFYEFIQRLTSRGYMTGYVCGGAGEPCVNNRPYFRPQNNATRGQTSKIVANAARIETSIPPDRQSFEDVPPSHTFWLWIERLATRNVMTGYECGRPGEPCVEPNNHPYFRPGNDVTRGQSAKIVANTFFPNCQTP